MDRGFRLSAVGDMPKLWASNRTGTPRKCATEFNLTCHVEKCLREAPECRTKVRPIMVWDPEVSRSEGAQFGVSESLLDS